MAEGTEGMRDRIARSSEEALGKLAQDLLENPLVSGALTARSRRASAPCRPRRPPWARSTSRRPPTSSG